MDRETAVKLWREIGLGMPGGGATGRLIEAFAVAVEAAERERLLSMPRLMHACDALGVRADGENCGLLRKALLEA